MVAERNYILIMYRLLYTNKNSGENTLLWRYYENGVTRYFKDVSLTDEVDIGDYDEVKLQHDIVNMPTPYQMFGIECEKGWYHLIQPIIDYIDTYNKDKDEEHMIYITQIKEKYGTLCVYVDNYTDELSELIEHAESESEHTCEICGSKEHVGTTLGWYITICHNCVKKRSEERNESIKWASFDDDTIWFINPKGENDKYVESFKEYNQGLQ